MSDSKVYTVQKTQSLIDLNKNLKNFKLRLTASKVDPNQPNFKAAIVDQTMLDSQNIQFRDVDSSISSTVVADKDVFQNFYLVLKCDSTAQVKVDTELTPINPGNYDERGHPALHSQSHDPNNIQDIPPDHPIHQVIQKQQQTTSWINKALIACAVVGAIALIWWFMSRNKKPDKKSGSGKKGKKKSAFKTKLFDAGDSDAGSNSSFDLEY